MGEIVEKRSVENKLINDVVIAARAEGIELDIEGVSSYEQAQAKLESTKEDIKIQNTKKKDIKKEIQLLSATKVNLNGLDFDGLTERLAVERYNMKKNWSDFKIKTKDTDFAKNNKLFKQDIVTYKQFEATKKEYNEFLINATEQNVEKEVVVKPGEE